MPSRRKHRRNAPRVGRTSPQDALRRGTGVTTRVSLGIALRHVRIGQSRSVAAAESGATQRYRVYQRRSSEVRAGLLGAARSAARSAASSALARTLGRTSPQDALRRGTGVPTAREVRGASGSRTEQPLARLGRPISGPHLAITRLPATFVRSQGRAQAARALGGGGPRAPGRRSTPPRSPPGPGCTRNQRAPDHRPGARCASRATVTSRSRSPAARPWPRRQCPSCRPRPACPGRSGSRCPSWPTRR